MYWVWMGDSCNGLRSTRQSGRPHLVPENAGEASGSQVIVRSFGWLEAPFSLFSTAMFFGFMGLYVPFFYIQIYALESTYIDKNLAFYLPVLLNTGSFFGRIVSDLSWSFC